MNIFVSLFGSKMGRTFLFGSGIITAVFLIAIPIFKHLDGPDYQAVSDSPVEFSDAWEQRVFCDSTKVGNDIYHAPPAKCPEQRLVDAVESEYMREFKASSQDIRHKGAVFIAQPINCAACTRCQNARAGCANGFRRIIVTLRGTKAEWGEVYMAELGHAMSVNRHGDLDAGHLKPYYPKEKRD